MQLHGADSLKLAEPILIELSFLIICFLQTHPNNFIIVEITGPQRLENGVFVSSFLRYDEGKNNICY